MPTSCCVPCCKSNYINGRDDNIPVFKFPRDSERRNKWLGAIHRGNFVIKKSTVICIKHFDEKFIIRNHTAVRPDGTVLTIPRMKLKLTDDAYPTIFKNHPLYMNSTPPAARRNPAERSLEIQTRQEDTRKREESKDTVLNFDDLKAKYQSKSESIEYFCVREDEDKICFLKVKGIATMSDRTGKSDSNNTVGGFHSTSIKEEPDDPGDFGIDIDQLNLSYAQSEIPKCEGTIYTPLCKVESFTEENELLTVKSEKLKSQIGSEEGNREDSVSDILSYEAKVKNEDGVCDNVKIMPVTRTQQEAFTSSVAAHCLEGHSNWKNTDNPSSNEDTEWHTCCFCHYKTRKNRNLTIHLKVKHNEKAEWYKCAYCEIKTKYKSHLISHFKLKHDNTEVYKCEYCEYKANCKRYVTRHMMINHDESAKWYRCQHCQYKSKDEHMVKRHSMKQHNEKSEWHPCRYCEFRTKSKFNLKRHVKIIHDEGAEWYQCQYCEYKTKDKGYFTKHMKRELKRKHV